MTCWTESHRCRGIALSVMLLMAMGLSTGCQTGQYVEGFDNGREKMALDPYDIVLTMRQAGFDDDQILEHGPTVRNAIAAQGGARIRSRQFTHAIFMVQDDELYGVSHRYGSFRYQPEEATFDHLSEQLLDDES